VSATTTTTKTDETTEGRQSTVEDVLLGKAQPVEFPSLEAEKLIWQDFLSVPMLLTGSARKFITAQQFSLLLKGRRRRSRRRKEWRWRSSRASPASPGTCPGRQLQLLLGGGKVSSAWLPLASPKCLPLSGLDPPTFCSAQSPSVLMLFLRFSELLCFSISPDTS